eukprot:CAMPEP_0181236638 /NCGR_PEP_ID=MMETSP1096-20121128/38296_1 /TAXON_ID=156174 ORGANISM="Chrysochromulina ericina, Strain CCMP281" /NCGR_SAMPLE_ID=MMETSP1096 /ASSEMBLY_ACC=CAM_ASM_000453 /LENGTH=84 /DNA_ID=CAMNT_0023331859 /DNA_START=346 /DNA_END=600 /DNA_ORIENTATION=+
MTNEVEGGEVSGREHRGQGRGEMVCAAEKEERVEMEHGRVGGGKRNSEGKMVVGDMVSERRAVGEEAWGRRRRSREMLCWWGGV